ncbi:MAG: hypothetical protein K0S53_510 [Bacteroidetes bacterium]|jgi:hypothetical protein|nr:hypothetical protein [Bacteroidota bacterium]MDF2451875.1 hypothetical protein [Bacteroidota bacterium]
MKKTKLFIAILLLTARFMVAQTATNFNCNDCAGTNHDLFTELNAGKVVVISFVMPCASCIGPTLSAYNEVQNYSSSNPGKVLFYIADDYGNTSCASLTTWCNTNGLGSVTKFSNTAVVETPYGAGGMPKILVFGGPNHTIFYNQNGMDVAAFNSAINSALVAAVGVKEYSVDNFKLSLFPNPVKDMKATISYELKTSSPVAIEIFNTKGDLAMSVLNDQQAIGKHLQTIDVSGLAAGQYFIHLKADSKTDYIKLIIAE